MEISFLPSPNHSSRHGSDVTGTVIHYTGAASARGTVRWFQMPESQVSAHYVIERNGDITRMVQLTRKAWHAGRSEMLHKGEMTSDANKFTIGIELANCGLLVAAEGDGQPSEFFWQAGRRLKPYRGPQPVRARLRYDNGATTEGWWEPYPEAQLGALDELLGHIRTLGFDDAAENLIGHEEIAMPFGVRKSDPGPVFPWSRFPRKSPRRTTGEPLPVGPQPTDPQPTRRLTLV